MSASAAILVRGAQKIFGNRRVLTGIDLDVAPGEILAVVGESGCGKSTLLRLLGSLETPDGGSVSVQGKVSIAFQDSRLLPWLVVWKNVVFGLNAGGEHARKRALAALEEVGLVHLANAWPGTLSGGEAQRVALARSLVRNPAVLLLDEPFGALDALTRIRMHALLRKLWEQHRFTIVLVTHDVDEALTLADRAIVLAGGKVLDEVHIDLDRPRDRLSAGFGALRRRLLDKLGVPTV